MKATQNIIKQYWINNGSRSVCVNLDAQFVTARLYVNSRETATLQTWKGKTAKGADRWAAKVLGY